MNSFSIRGRTISDLTVRPLNLDHEQTLTTSQLLWSREVYKIVDLLIRNQHSNSLTEEPSSALISDKWGFGWSWPAIVEHFPTKEDLYQAIRDRRDQIDDTRESWRHSILADERLKLFYDKISQVTVNKPSDGVFQIEPRQLAISEEGIGGTYFLSDAKGSRQFVVKPVDEDIGCLNNPKGFSSPFTESTVRDNITLYLSSIRETLAYEFAQKIGIGQIVPETVLAIAESDSFHDQSDSIDPTEKENYVKNIGTISKEKLCSFQEYVPHSKTLFEALQEFQAVSLSDAEIIHRIDQRDFEDANILMWLTYDTDGHLNNFLVYPKSVDAIGNEIYGIKKIDNGLAFPEKNEQLRNNLRYLPNAQLILSEQARTKIASLSIGKLSDLCQKYGLDGSIDALRIRLEALQNIITNPDLTIREIDSRMEKLHEK